MYFMIYVLFNIFAFSLMGIDKSKAKRRVYRVKESTLWTAALFGPIGAYIGMYYFRHKTKKTTFRVGFFILVLLHLACFTYIMKEGWMTNGINRII